MVLGKYRGVPERWNKEGIFVYKQQRVVAGDEVEALRNLKDTDITKGTKYKISSILIIPKDNVRGFDKRIKLKGYEGEFNPQRFRKVS